MQTVRRSLRTGLPARSEQVRSRRVVGACSLLLVGAWFAAGPMQARAQEPASPSGFDALASSAREALSSSSSNFEFGTTSSARRGTEERRLGAADGSEGLLSGPVGASKWRYQLQMGGGASSLLKGAGIRLQRRF